MKALVSKARGRQEGRLENGQWITWDVSSWGACEPRERAQLREKARLGAAAYAQTEPEELRSAEWQLCRIDCIVCCINQQ